MSRTLVVGHGSAELYGSDLQLVESVRAALADGWDVLVVLPVDGPLAERLAGAGARVRVAPVPVLRKSLLRPRALPGLAWGSLRAVVGTVRLLRRERADAVYVNTVTIPTWLAAARLARVPALCHVHEAEDDLPRLVTALLTAPVLLARTVVTNSEAARRSLGAAYASLSARAHVVHNGVTGPPAAPEARAPHDEPLRLALVGRLSPRKGTDVALDAVGLLTAEGRDVRLQVAGSTFPGYEWFEEQLRQRAAADDLAGRVELLGFVHPTWPVLADADVVLIPSRVEPFGNTAVEALLAQRPVVASRTQGLAEIVRDGTTGLLVEPGDAAALAAAVGRLVDDRELRERLAADGRRDAETRFSTSRYATDLQQLLREVVGAPTDGRTGLRDGDARGPRQGVDGGRRAGVRQEPPF